MTIGATYRRRIALACGVFVFAVASAGSALAAPRAAEIGPEAPLAQPAGGYVGRLSVTPEHGPVGTPVTVTSEGLPALGPDAIVPGAVAPSTVAMIAAISVISSAPMPRVVTAGVPSRR